MTYLHSDYDHSHGCMYCGTGPEPKNKVVLSEMRLVGTERSFNPMESKACISKAELKSALEYYDLASTSNQSYHGWRCQHPDRFGLCDCFAILVEDLWEILTSEEPISPS